MNSNRILEFSRLTVSPRRWFVKEPVLFTLSTYAIAWSQEGGPLGFVVGAQGGYFRCGSNTRIAHQRALRQTDWKEYPFRWSKVS
ncbi:hypothetical protein [Caballeronia zhejiangensis]|uniref:hypothetical protein n=1 Tax=Caballeronia zhejiangensis TaxID=871203 RepID=UPI001ABBD69B|nr:hypothetical protein [Caballeronia zhejiangensis]